MTYTAASTMTKDKIKRNNTTTIQYKQLHIEIKRRRDIITL